MALRDRISLAACGAAVVVAVFAIGGAPRWAQAAVAAIAAVAVGSIILSKRGFEKRPPLLTLIGAALGCTALQLVPLPQRLVHALSPTLVELRDDGAPLANVSVASTLTMDSPSTLRAVAFLLILIAVATIALRIAISERGRYALMSAVAGTAGAAAAISGAHKLFGATSLYGVYHPLQAAPPFMGPLLNSNHLGCLMAVGVAASVGLLFYQKQSSVRRSIWALIALGCGAIALETLSRGAALALVCGVGVVVATVALQQTRQWEQRSRRRREKFLATTLPIGIMIACGLVTAAYIGAGAVIHQLEDTSLREVHNSRSKFAAWRSSYTLVEESPWAGIGRGAFEPTFTRVHAASAFGTFSHPENEAVQAVVEWGVPATLLFGLLVAQLLVRALRRWRDGPLVAGALGVVAAVAFQSNFDFGMELLGLAIPVTIALATLSYVPLAELPPHRLIRTRVLRALFVAGLLGATALLLSTWTTTIEEDHIAVHAATPARIRESIQRHPLDYYGYAALADAMVRTNDPDAVRLLNHALRLHPTHAGLHRLAARLLLRTNRIDQAASEFTTALRYAIDARPVLAEMFSSLSTKDVAAAMPTDLEVDKTVRMLQEANRPEIALLWLDRVLANKNDLRGADAMYSIALEQKNYVAAERAGRIRCQLAPSAPCTLALARVLALAQKPAEIIEQLQDVAYWHGHRDDRIEAWFMLCDAQFALGNIGETTACLRKLEASGLLPSDAPELRRRNDAVIAGASK